MKNKNTAMIDRIKQSKKLDKPAETSGKEKLPRPIVFWSDNERDAFRRNRVVQTRCSMLLDEINVQRESSKRAIRYEAHKFRQRNVKYFRHPDSNAETDCRKEHTAISSPKTNPSSCFDNEARTIQNDLQENNRDPDDDQFPKMTGIITRTRKPSVRFNVIENKPERSSNKNMDENSTDTNDSVKEIVNNNGRGTDRKPSIKRSLSAVYVRGNYGNRLLRRQTSAGITLRSNITYHNMETVENLSDRISSSPRSETFFVKSKAAYLLRQDLKRQAVLRKQGVTERGVSLSDILRAEKEKFIQSTGKMMEYMKRIDTEKLFRPIIINKWTAADIEKEL